MTSWKQYLLLAFLIFSASAVIAFSTTLIILTTRLVFAVVMPRVF